MVQTFFKSLLLLLIETNTSYLPISLLYCPSEVNFEKIFFDANHEKCHHWFLEKQYGFRSLQLNSIHKSPNAYFLTSIGDWTDATLTTILHQLFN